MRHRQALPSQPSRGTSAVVSAGDSRVGRPTGVAGRWHEDEEQAGHGPGWDAIPEGLVSRNEGSNWLKSGRTALLRVPSVIIGEEDNVMLNPAHPDSARIGAAKVRRFLYDHRV